MTNINEIWKDVPNYEGYYQVSSFGKIKTIRRFSFKKNCKKGYWVKEMIGLGSINHYGYMQFSLSKDGVSKKVILHRIIAGVFIPNPENKRTVNHLNGVKTDNHISNLEWATDSENNKHSFDFLGRVGGATGRNTNNKKEKPVYCNGVRFESIKECASALGITPNSIRTAICAYGGRFGRKSNRDLLFKY